MSAPSLGHNRPPDEIDDQANTIQERLRGDHNDLLTRAEELKAALPYVPEKIDETTAGSTGDFIKQITGTIKDANARRVAEKEPYLSGGRAVDGFFKPVADGLAKIKGNVEERLRRSCAASLSSSFATAFGM